MKYACAECGSKQCSMDRCQNCGSFRVVLISVLEELFGVDWKSILDKTVRH